MLVFNFFRSVRTTLQDIKHKYMIKKDLMVYDDGQDLPVAGQFYFIGRLKMPARVAEIAIEKKLM
jgi:hypothetical protein